jgi:hypothetical protein
MPIVDAVEVLSHPNEDAQKWLMFNQRNENLVGTRQKNALLMSWLYNKVDELPNVMSNYDEQQM